MFNFLSDWDALFSSFTLCIACVCVCGEGVYSYQVFVFECTTLQVYCCCCDCGVVVCCINELVTLPAGIDNDSMLNLYHSNLRYVCFFMNKPYYLNYIVWYHMLCLIMIYICTISVERCAYLVRSCFCVVLNSVQTGWIL